MSEKLCSFDDVRLFKDNHKDVAANNSLIEHLIEVKSDAFIKYCSVDGFKLNTYTEYIDGEGGGYLFVRNTPIVSVTNIYIDHSWEWGSDSTLGSDYYRIVDKRYITSKRIFARLPQIVKIEYTAGYTDIPADLKQACVEEVVRSFNRRNSFDVTATSMPDGSVSYNEKGWLKSTIQILNQYRNIRTY